MSEAGKAKRSKRRSVAFQGEHGAFSEAAAASHFQAVHGEEIDSQGHEDFADVFGAVATGAADFGIVPVENSASGTLHTVYDMLLNSSLSIVGECSSIEEHCLCALPGTALGSVTSVLSHPAMFEQCGQFLKKMDAERGTRLTREASWDTAAACAQIKDGKMANAAAIASREAADMHKLAILEAGIGNDKNNETRYLLVANKPFELPDSAWHARIKLKCSIAVALQNAPNALFKMVSCFALRNLNILKIESRPASTASATTFKGDSAPGSPKRTIKHWDYIFYIDYEPSWDSGVNDNMLRSLSEFSVGVRSFGTYHQNLPDVVAVHSPWHGLAQLATC